MPDKSGGRIITFYSYKGGTGRSMALANTAWILASAGRRVLMIDWDLEAPGLHRYFHPFMSDKTLVRTKGVIDMVFEYQRLVLAQENAAALRALPDAWYDENIDVFRYITEFDWDHQSQPGFGELHLLPAGQQTADYGARVNTFNWHQLYDNLGGYKFIEAVKRQLRREYDYILVDSRTGVSDTSGLCTVQMPDTVVVCFTLNSQSIEGASEVALGVREQRKIGSKTAEPAPEAPLGEECPFRVFPVPMRIEKAEKHKLDLARDAARSRFDTFVSWLEPAERERYWGSVEIFYEPFYAYEEMLATVADKPGSIVSLLASIERLVGYIAEKDIQMPSVPESLRQELVVRYERRRAEPDNPSARAAALLLRFSIEDADVARSILLQTVEPSVGGGIVRRSVATADVMDRAVLSRLVDEGVLTRKLGDGDIEYVMINDERLLDWPTLRGWVREYEDALRLRPVLEDLAIRWEDEGRGAQMALPTGVLAAATAAVSLERRLFSPRVAAFISREIERQRRRRIAGRWAVAVILLVLISAGSFNYIDIWWRDNQILNRAHKKLNPQDKLKYVWVSPGRFQMGCSYGGPNCDSFPVKLNRGYWIGQTEVTNAAYRRYLAARDQSADSIPDNNLPVGSVGWLDAVDYCSWAGGRLPWEEEWEYAARGGVRGARFITGDTLDKREVNIGGSPQPVASYSPNGFGLYDMTGNVAEWTNSRGKTYLNYRSANYSDDKPLNDPRYEPVPGEPLVVRGGSYLSISPELELHFGRDTKFDIQEPTIGFRCVIEGTDLEMVAHDYRINPFSGLYGAYGLYGSQSLYGGGGYSNMDDWWHSLYLRNLGAEQRRARQ